MTNTPDPTPVSELAKDAKYVADHLSAYVEEGDPRSRAADRVVTGLADLETRLAAAQVDSLTDHESYEQLQDDYMHLQERLEAEEREVAILYKAAEATGRDEDRLKRERDEAREVTRKYGLALIMIAGDCQDTPEHAKGSREIAQAALRLATDEGGSDG